MDNSAKEVGEIIEKWSKFDITDNTVVGGWSKVNNFSNIKKSKTLVTI